MGLLRTAAQCLTLVMCDAALFICAWESGRSPLRDYSGFIDNGLDLVSLLTKHLRQFDEIAPRI